LAGLPKGRVVRPTLEICMYVFRRAAVPALLALTGWLAAPAGAAEPPPSASAHVPGELIVRFSARADGSRRASLRDSVDASAVRGLPLPGGQLLRLQSDTDVDTAIARLERAPDVLYAEPNVVRTGSATMNDPYFGYLWGLRNAGQNVQGTTGTAGDDIAAPTAWDLTTGSTTAPVAVIDSGAATDHPDLRGQTTVNTREVAGNGIDDDRNGYVDDVSGWDFVGNDPVPDDANGHGTHVAGTIAARGDDGVGVVGVAPTSRVMPLRVLDANGSGTVADVIAAYGYAARNAARVVNLSLGGDSSSRAERDALAAAPDVLFVAAAGNGGSDGVGDDNDVAGEYPCAYSLANVLCVAASDRDDQLASFSNFGATTVDLAAPGVNILSDQPLSTTGAAQYAFFNGTSMATPHVAGAAALAFAVRPASSVAEVKQALLDGTDARPAFAGRTVSGGRLDARRTLELLSGAASAPAPAPAVAPAADSTSAAPAPSTTTVPTTTSPAPAPTTAAPGPAPTTQPAPMSDTVAPLASLSTAARQRVRTVRRLGLRLRATCLENCTATALLSLSPRDAKRLRLGSGNRTVSIGRRVRALTSASTTALAVRLTPTASRALARLTRPVTATLTVVFVDAAGNRRTLRKAVTLGV